MIDDLLRHLITTVTLLADFSESRINLMLTVGSQGLYEWLVTDDDFNLLELCPEIVFGKYVAISSLDSGEFVPTDEETANGWQSREGLRTVQKSSTLKMCHMAAGTNGTSSTIPLILVPASMNKALFASVRDAVKTIGTRQSPMVGETSQLKHGA